MMSKVVTVILYAGFTIPKGWRIYVYTREINYDPHLYEDPLAFNPWRWMVRDNLDHNPRYIISCFYVHEDC